jgi:DNA-binding transcriptional MerR regulator
MPMGRLYRVNEFAKLAGVTVRALHHYDRLGLLKRQKTAAGYRLYAETDLERLEQIIALKFLGIPLKQIKVVLLDRNALDLLDALRLQRAALEEKQRLLERAIAAIHDAEKAIQGNQPASATILKKIIEVVRMQEHEDFMKPYFGDKAWVRWSKRREPWPSEVWIALFRDVQASLGEDPGSPQAQALATR